MLGTELVLNLLTAKLCVYGKKLMAISAVGMLLLEETFSVLLESLLRGESTV